MKRGSSDIENLQSSTRESSRKRVRSHQPQILDNVDALDSPTLRKSRRSDQSSSRQSPTKSSRLNAEENEDGIHLADYIELDIESQTASERDRRRPKKGTEHLRKVEEVSTPVRHTRGISSICTPTTNGIGADHTNGRVLDLSNADRSARRKSARKIIERAILDDLSEDDDDQDLARHIYESEDEDDDDNDIAGSDRAADSELLGTVDVSETPSKRPRIRPKGSKNRKRSPTPPQDLPPYELYFFQNRAGGTKTSNSNLSSLKLLDHEEYFDLIHDYKDSHTEDMDFLQELHSRSFGQWHFELSQDFNICIYGLGSKRKLLTSFAEYVYKSRRDHHSKKVVIVNGYVHNTTVRDILNTLAGAILEQPPKLGSQATEMLEAFCELLEADRGKHITLIIHSIDASQLRKPVVQILLARLASHPQIQLVASADHPSFHLLWDSSLRSTYNFLFHDCTTFQPYTVEVDVVNEVHELLGRSGRRVGGKEGVTFVLKVLNQNSRKLFQLLIAEQLATLDENSGLVENDDNNSNAEESDRDRRHGNVTSNKSHEQGVEYRLLYQKAVEDFICGDEVAFRTLLKEFHDHQMIYSRKDAMGTEMLSVPFRKEELETILEDLMA